MASKLGGGYRCWFEVIEFGWMPMRVGLNAIESLDECRGAMPECYLGEHLLGPCEGLRAQDSTRLEVPPLLEALCYTE